MANRIITPSLVAKEAVMMLDNELVMANKVNRDYEEEFDKKPNGYSIGDTITIGRPNDFTVRDGRVASAQDAQEGKTTLVVDKFKGVDFKFTSQQLTQDIKSLSERVIRPAMIQLANQVDVDIHALYKYVPNWVGTPGNLINSFADFAKGPERLDNTAVPPERTGVLCPSDHWALVGSQTSLYAETLVKPAYREGESGKIGGVDLYSTANVATHTCGADMSGTVNQSVVTSTITWADVRDSNQQTITTSSVNFNAGDVFTIDDVYEINPVTKVSTGVLKQFTTISYSSNSLVFSPAIIWTGAHATAAITSGVTDLNTKAITGVGTANTAYRQNMIFHRKAFALAMVPLVAPPGAVEVGRQTYKGLSVRVIPVYDGINDESLWRLDILYGVKAVDPRLATRISGSA